MSYIEHIYVYWRNNSKVQQNNIYCMLFGCETKNSECDSVQNNMAPLAQVVLYIDFFHEAVFHYWEWSLGTADPWENSARGTGQAKNRIQGKDGYKLNKQSTCGHWWNNNVKKPAGLGFQGASYSIIKTKLWVYLYLSSSYSHFNIQEILL